MTTNILYASEYKVAIRAYQGINVAIKKQSTLDVVTKTIIEKQNRFISFVSEENLGTTFYVDMPEFIL